MEDSRTTTLNIKEKDWMISEAYSGSGPPTFWSRTILFLSLVLKNIFLLYLPAFLTLKFKLHNQYTSPFSKILF